MGCYSALKKKDNKVPNILLKIVPFAFCIAFEFEF